MYLLRLKDHSIILPAKLTKILKFPSIEFAGFVPFDDMLDHGIIFGIESRF